MITAPSHNSPYLRMMEKQLEELDQVPGAFVVLNASCRLKL